MNDITVVQPRPVLEATGQAGERRRTGRVAYENPDLINLLRGSPSTEGGSVADVLCADDAAECGNAPELGDDLTAAKGILTSFLLSLGCWIIIGLVFWMFRPLV